MMKHILCIMICALFVFSFGGIKQEVVLGTKAQTQAVACMEKATQQTESTCYVAEDVCALSFTHNNQTLFDSADSAYKFNSGIFSSSFSLKEITPSKVLKLGVSKTIIRLLSQNLGIRLSDDLQNHVSYAKSFSKYSCEYYVYTLGHILI